MKLERGILFHDHYILKDLIGRGGFSEVWLAQDKYTQLEIAIKVYAPGSGMDSDGIKMFSDEISAVYNLNHTNILKPQHFDVCDGMPYLVLPYCKYGSCKKWIKKMGEDAVWHLLKDVSAGLEYLHRMEVIHQDIKPDNILVNSYNDFMLTDFGISSNTRRTICKSMLNTSDISNDGAGTMAYMGPERFGKQKGAVKASDIWALGATVFELMTGDVPFGNGVIGGGLLQKSGAELPDMPETYSKSLKDLVVRMLSIETWDRPTAKEIKEIAIKESGGVNKDIPIKKKSNKGWIIGIVVCILTIVVGFLIYDIHKQRVIAENTRWRNEQVNKFEKNMQSASKDNLDGFDSAINNLEMVKHIENNAECNKYVFYEKKNEIKGKLEEVQTTLSNRYRTAVSGSSAESSALKKLNRVKKMITRIDNIN